MESITELLAKEALGNLNLSELVKYAQIMPVEFVAELERAAGENGISMELEIVSRLFATLLNPCAFGIDLLCEQILKKNFTENEAFAECKRNKQSNFYIYEMEKLKLFMRYQGKIPRDAKESFLVIDVKEAAKIIKAELEGEEAEAETKKNKGNKKTNIKGTRL